jgi:GNAT superfamily N-acetyltransferase
MLIKETVYEGQEIFLEALEHGKHTGEVVVYYGSTGSLRKLLERKAEAAEEEGEIMGPEVMRQAADYLADVPDVKSAYVALIQVHRDKQRGGVGTALMEHALGRMREIVVGRVLLHHDPDKPELGAFYRKLGFKKVRNPGATMLFEGFPMMELVVSKAKRHTK